MFHNNGVVIEQAHNVTKFRFRFSFTEENNP